MITDREFDKILDTFRDELKIDKYSLEDECVRHPDIYAKYSKLYAEAVQDMELAKLERNKVEAELDREIRLKHEIYGFIKPPSVDSVERWIKSQDKYVVAQTNLIQARYRLNILDGIKWTAQFNKSSLGYLVNLFLNNYYSDIPVKGVKEVREQEARERYDKQVEILNQGNQRLLKRRITNGS